MGELIGYADQITSYGFSSTDLGNKASLRWSFRQSQLYGFLMNAQTCNNQILSPAEGAGDNVNQLRCFSI
ncbi:hypothetical protein, partial [Shewanella xiamenensis]|uniref:hypothetical protein n=1 Tax=Shewanella xiamenensis TaxID=332186 RepID=UPI0035BA6B2E